MGFFSNFKDLINNNGSKEPKGHLIESIHSTSSLKDMEFFIHGEIASGTIEINSNELNDEESKSEDNNIIIQF